MYQLCTGSGQVRIVSYRSYRIVSYRIGVYVAALFLGIVMQKKMLRIIFIKFPVTFTISVHWCLLDDKANSLIVKYPASLT